MPQDSEAAARGVLLHWKNKILAAAAVVTAVGVIGTFAHEWFGMDVPPWYSKDEGNALLIELVEARLDFWTLVKIQAAEDVENNPDSDSSRIALERARIAVDQLQGRLQELTGRSGNR